MKLTSRSSRKKEGGYFQFQEGCLFRRKMEKYEKPLKFKNVQNIFINLHHNKKLVVMEKN